MTVEGARPRRPRKGPGRPPRADSDQTRARILDTATTNFALNGFADTPVSAVAEDAGVTTGTLYYYFGSKTRLYEAVAERVRARVNDDLVGPVLAEVAGQPTLEARLTTLVAVLARRAAEDVGLHRLGFAGDLEAGHFAAVKAFRDGVRTDLRRLYAGVAGLDPDATPTAEQAELLGFVEALTLGMWHYAIRPGGLERLPIFVEAFQSLLDGTLLDD